jgi:hypothetical protein
MQAARVALIPPPERTSNFGKHYIFLLFPPTFWSHFLWIDTNKILAVLLIADDENRQELRRSIILGKILKIIRSLVVDNIFLSITEKSNFWHHACILSWRNNTYNS